MSSAEKTNGNDFPWREVIEENEACEAIAREVRGQLTAGRLTTSGELGLAQKVCERIMSRIALRRLSRRIRGAVYAQEALDALRELRDSTIAAEEMAFSGRKGRDRYQVACREASSLLERVAELDAARLRADLYAETEVSLG